MTTTAANSGSNAVKMPRASLSSSTPTTPTRLLKAKPRPAAAREGCRTRWVVRDIDKHRGGAPYYFQSPRDGDIRETFPHNVDVEDALAPAKKPLDRHQGATCIVCLVCAVQRQVDLLILPTQSPQRELLTAHGKLAILVRQTQNPP